MALRDFWYPVAFNKALAAVGLGSVGMVANVPKDIRMALIEAGVESRMPAESVVAMFFFRVQLLGKIPPSHANVARRKMDEWAAKRRTPEPDEVYDRVFELSEGLTEPQNEVEKLIAGI